VKCIDLKQKRKKRVSVEQKIRRKSVKQKRKSRESVEQNGKIEKV